MDMPTIISVTRNAEQTLTSLQLAIDPGLDGFHRSHAAAQLHGNRDGVHDVGHGGGVIGIDGK